MSFGLKDNQQVKAATEKRDCFFSLSSVYLLPPTELQKEKQWEKWETQQQAQVEKWQQVEVWPEYKREILIWSRLQHS